MKPFDFSLVERVRKAALLSVNNMADYLGITRQSYYNYLKGAPPRSQYALNIKAKLRVLLTALNEGRFPTEEADSASASERYDLLKRVLNQDK